MPVGQHTDRMAKSSLYDARRTVPVATSTHGSEGFGLTRHGRSSQARAQAGILKRSTLGVNSSPVSRASINSVKRGRAGRDTLRSTGLLCCLHTAKVSHIYTYLKCIPLSPMLI